MYMYIHSKRTCSTDSLQAIQLGLHPHSSHSLLSSAFLISSTLKILCWMPTSFFEDSTCTSQNFLKKKHFFFISFHSFNTKLNDNLHINAQKFILPVCIYFEVLQKQTGGLQLTVSAHLWWRYMFLWSTTPLVFIIRCIFCSKLMLSRSIISARSDSS